MLAVLRLHNDFPQYIEDCGGFDMGAMQDATSDEFGPNFCRPRLVPSKQVSTQDKQLLWHEGA
jgi:hypothetical protein